MSLRLALRRLAATPAFTVGAIAVLALGSGATLAVFTVLNALVFKTLPVSEPDRLVAIEVQTARGEPAVLPSLLFEALVRQQQSLDRVTGLLGGSVVSADAGGVIHQAVVDGVTADYFSVRGMSISWAGHSATSTTKMMVRTRMRCALSVRATRGACLGRHQMPSGGH